MDNFGNPYIETGIDKSGKIAIEWGLYGVPETFLINKKGEISYHHHGYEKGDEIKLKKHLKTL